VEAQLQHLPRLDERSLCWESLRKVAARARLSPGTVAWHVKQLRAAGVLVDDRRSVRGVVDMRRLAEVQASVFPTGRRPVPATSSHAPTPSMSVDPSPGGRESLISAIEEFTAVTMPGFSESTARSSRRRELLQLLVAELGGR
jgi:hypothetical protein